MRVEYLTAADIERAAEGRRHGGVLALAGEREYLPLESLLLPQPVPFLFLPDGIEDPYNFGQATRSVYAAGATGLLLRPRNWMSAAGIVARASAGASELIQAALVDSPSAAHSHAAESGIEVIVLESSASQSLFEHDLRKPILLVVGGEQRGVSRSFRSLPYTNLSIPSARDDARALGSAAATAVAAYEVLRQRAGT